MPTPKFAALAAVLIGAAIPARAQSSGTGYLFGAPSARLSVRAGYAGASATGDLFDFATSNLTLNRGDFGSPTAGAELGFPVAPRLDVALSVDYAAAMRHSEDRRFLDNNQQPIEQTTSFRRVPLMATARLSLTSRGRSVGRLAWVPSRVVPWIGAGVGTMWYRFRQEGDFVDYQTLIVFPATIETSGWAGAVQGLGGVDISLSPRLALTGDARYTWSHAKPDGGFQSFDKIDLSGVTAGLGLTIRL
jgi:hypothetical protein